MRKVVCSIVAAMTALTICATASANIIDGVGNAVEEVVEGAGDAVRGVADGAEDLVEGVVDEGENIGNHVPYGDDNIVNKDGEILNEVHGAENENEEHTEETTEETTEVTTEVTTAVTTAPVPVDTNPKTGSFEMVTFGAFALGAAAIAATSRKRK